MTTIDHLSFPHIIDQIWSSLSADDLLHMRAVCKSWLVRADFGISGHLVIERNGESDYEVRARCFDHPGVTERIAGCCCNSQDGSDEDVERPRCRFCQRLEDGVTFDVVGFTPDDVDPYSSPFCQVPEDATLRWLAGLADCSNTSWNLLPASSHIFFHRYDGTTNLTLDLDIDKSALYGSRESESLVFNFNCTANPTTTVATAYIDIPVWQNSLNYGGSEGASLTFIFHDKRVKRKKAAPLNPTFVASLLQSYPSVEVCVNLVGLEQFLQDDQALEEFVSCVFNRYVDNRSEVFDDDEPREELEEMCEEEWKMVRFLTMKEYEEEIGEDRFLVETVM